MNALTENFRNAGASTQGGISQVPTEFSEIPEIATTDVLQVKPSDKITIVEDTLTQMQSKLAAIKQAKQTQEDLSVTVQELSIKLAEAQAEEIMAAENLLELEIEWQELTKKLTSFADLNAGSN